MATFRFDSRVLLGVALGAIIGFRPAVAWTVDEHRTLGDSVMSVVAADLVEVDRAAGDRMSFGTLCAWAAVDDRTRARYHLGNRTLREELEDATAGRIDARVLAAKREGLDLIQGGAARFRAQVRRSRAGNVAASYFTHHAAALRMAAEEPHDGALRRAVIEESIAQGYLADAFAAGHLMPPPALSLGRFYHFNRGRLHDDYANLGVYVANARGDAWQTFGDRLLLWYGPSLTHVFEACVSSLREVMLVSCVARDQAPQGALASWADSLARVAGMSRQDLARSWVERRDAAEFFVERRLPTLMLIPTSIVATWSVRTPELDEHRQRRRHHYPQLAESGGHDPTLSPAEVARLPARAAVPDWMIPDTLFLADPLALVRDHPDFASARYVQARHEPPSYTGLVVSVGEIRWDEGSGGGGHHAYGVGFSPSGENTLLIHRISLDGLVLEPSGDDGPHAFAVAFGFNPRLPAIGITNEPWLRWINLVHLSWGHAWGRGVESERDGARYTAGIESAPVPLRFTNAALALRLEGQWLRLEHARRGLGLSLVMQ